MPAEIADGIYDITLTERYGRRYRVFLVDGDVPTLFDAGFADTAEALYAGIEGIGIEPERLVITHSDPDHIGGLDAVVEEYGVETWVPEATVFDADATPEYRYGDGTRIGDFEAIHVPGHSADSSALVDESRGLAVMGDVVYGSDARGLPPGYMILPSAGFSDDLHAAERNLEKLLPYDFDIALVYHGSPILRDAGARLERFVNYPGKELADAERGDGSRR